MHIMIEMYVDSSPRITYLTFQIASDNSAVTDVQAKTIDCYLL